MIDSQGLVYLGCDCSIGLWPSAGISEIQWACTYNGQHSALQVLDVISPSGDERPKQDVMNEKWVAMQTVSLARRLKKALKARLKTAVCCWM